MYNRMLTAFVCAADCGSFNKAAEKLYLSPPSVMKQVNALEKHLDLQLFERDAHGIRLTAAGQIIYRHARQMFAYSEQAIAEARRAARAGDDHAEAALTGRSGIFAQQIGCAVGTDHPLFEFDAELFEHRHGIGHHLIIAHRAHNHSDFHIFHRV